MAARTEASADSDTTPSPGQLPLDLAVAALLGLICLVATLVAIRGPARATSTTVTWPDSSRENSILGPAPWGTPLLLAERFPDRLSASVDCSRTEKWESGATIVLATSRNPSATGSLELRMVDGQLVLMSGSSRLASVDVPLGLQGCELLFRLRETQWTLTVTGSPPVVGEVDLANVAGLYSDLARPGETDLPIKVAVTPQVQDSSPTARQLGANATAIATGLAALFLLRRGFESSRTHARHRRRPIDRFDLGVAVTLVLFTIVGSPQPDDGWFMATVVNHDASGTYSFYFDHLNLRTMFGFVHYELLAVLRALGDSLLVARLPALACGAVTWRLCRHASRLLFGEQAWRISDLSLAAVFSLAWVANNVTVRPEPLVAMLVMVSANGSLAFAAERRISLLAAPCLATAVAVSIHPDGLVAVVPLALAAQPVIREVRSNRERSTIGIGTISNVSAATWALLFFADSDVALTSRNQALLATSSVYGGLASEWQRYHDLFTKVGFGSPMRRMAVLLPVLLALSLVSSCVAQRRTRGWSSMQAALLLVGTMAALAPSPSKWTFHLGVVAGPAALVAAAWALQRQPKDQPERPRRVAEGVVLVGGSALLAYAILREPRTLRMHSLVPVGSALSNATLVATVMAAISAVGSIWYLRRLRKRATDGALRSSTVGVPAAVAVAWVATVGVLYSVDGFAPSQRWTLPSQLLVQPADCGPAAMIRVADPSRGNPLASTGPPQGFAPTPNSDRPGVGVRWEAEVKSGRAHEAATTPSWRLPPRAATGPPVLLLGFDRGAEVTFQFLDRSGRVIARRAPVRPLDVGGAEFATTVPVPAGESIWSFRVRLERAGGSRKGRAIIGEPRSVRWERLDRLLTAAGVRTLASQGMANAISCARLPNIARGVAESPDYYVWPVTNPRPDVPNRSPFSMTSDPFDGTELAVWSDTDHLREEIRVFKFDRSRLRPFGGVVR